MVTKEFFGKVIGVPDGTMRAGQSRSTATILCSTAAFIYLVTEKLSPQPHSDVALGLRNCSVAFRPCFT